MIKRFCFSAFITIHICFSAFSQSDITLEAKLKEVNPEGIETIIRSIEKINENYVSVSCWDNLKI